MKRRVLAAMGFVVVALVGTAPAAHASSAKSIKHRLANVVVPANCDMPKQRLHHGKTAKRFLPAQGNIDFGVPHYSAAPIKVHLRRHGTQLLAQYNCTAGGVNYPETLVLYSRHNRLIASLDLYDLSHQEHAQVQSWRVKGHTVKVNWESYEGAGFEIHHHKSTLRLKGHRLRLT